MDKSDNKDLAAANLDHSEMVEDLPSPNLTDTILTTDIPVLSEAALTAIVEDLVLGTNKSHVAKRGLRYFRSRTFLLLSSSMILKEFPTLSRRGAQPQTFFRLLMKK
jgi:hypothetical protein